MEEMSAVGFLQHKAHDTTSASLEGPAAAKLAASVRGKQEVSAAAHQGVPGNGPSDCAEVMAMDCGGLKTARRRWLEPPSAVTAEAGQTGRCTEDVVMGGLPSGPSQQGELAAEIRWLLVRQKGVRAVQGRKGAEQEINMIDYGLSLICPS